MFGVPTLEPLVDFVACKELGKAHGALVDVRKTPRPVHNFFYFAVV